MVKKSQGLIFIKTKSYLTMFGFFTNDEFTYLLIRFPICTMLFGTVDHLEIMFRLYSASFREKQKYGKKIQRDSSI